MEMSHHGSGIGIVEKIDHRAMAAGDENSVIPIQARCDHIRDASWISQASQAVAEFEIVLEPGLVPAEEIGDRGMEIQFASGMSSRRAWINMTLFSFRAAMAR